MSIVNTMLRDLEARGDDQRAARIAVRKPRARQKNRAMPVALAVAAVVAASVAIWREYTARDLQPVNAAMPPQDVIAPASGVAPVAPAEVVAAQTVDSRSAAMQQASQPAKEVAQAAEKPRAQWSWSDDGFALQLPHVDGLRYGVERVSQDTLRITLSLSASAPIVVPTPTPAWVDNVRVQQDDIEQRLTIRADARLEYDIAANASDAVVVSAWRSDERAVQQMPAEPELAQNKVATRMAEPTAIATQPARQNAPERAHKPPQVTPTQLTPAQQDERVAAQAATQLRAGDTQAAMAQLRNATERLAAAPHSAALLVTVLMSQQRMQEAQPILERALLNTPDDVQLRKLKARMLAARGEPALGLAQLSSLQKQHVQDVELLALCAGLAQQARDFPLAANYYLQWSRLEPRNGAAWYGLAVSLDAQGSPANAVAAYRQALALVTDTRLRSYAATRVDALSKAKTDSVLSVAREGG